jgi:heterotetrameric sarcosine oxidase gamma subunit
MQVIIGEERLDGVAGVLHAPRRLSPMNAAHDRLGATFMEQAGWQVPARYTSATGEAAAIREAVGVMDISASGKVLVRGAAAEETLAALLVTVPRAPGEATAFDEKESGRGYVAMLAPDELMVITSPGAEAGLAGRLAEEVTTRGLFVSIVNQTSGLAGLMVVGPRYHELLSKLCAIPLHPAAFPVGRVAQSGVAKVHAILVRQDLAPAVPAIEIYVDRPYGEYVWEAVLDAGGEYGIQPVGLDALELLTKEGR